MPLFWRYLLKQYVQNFCFIVCCLLSLLIITRLESIAQLFINLHTWLPAFAGIGLIIPHIFPLASAFASLLATFFVFQRMSTSQELIALQVAGCSFWQLFKPVFFASAFLCFSNFMIVGEIDPRCHKNHEQVLQDLSLQHPFFFLQKAKNASIFLEAPPSSDRYILGIASPKGLITIIGKHPTVSPEDIALSQATLFYLEPTHHYLNIQNHDTIVFRKHQLGPLLSKTYTHLEDTYSMKALIDSAFTNKVSAIKELFRRLFLVLSLPVLTYFAASVVFSCWKTAIKIPLLILSVAVYFVVFFLGKSLISNLLMSGVFLIAANVAILALSYVMHFKGRAKRP